MTHGGPRGHGFGMKGNYNPNRSDRAQIQKYRPMAIQRERESHEARRRDPHTFDRPYKSHEVAHCIRTEGKGKDQGWEDKTRQRKTTQDETR